ncbi:MAG: hypothetical protein PUE81_09465, partial [Lachnospiraceae bacterium]|nr:hypothetical protein [Lachnospiraceae bacterium]
LLLIGRGLNHCGTSLMYRHATYEQSEYVVMKELRKSNNLYEVLKVQKTIAFYNEIVYDK